MKKAKDMKIYDLGFTNYDLRITID